jgi:hypothetical protein
VPALVVDPQRNAQICDDVAAALREGRNCLVLTGRTDHVDRLAGALRTRGCQPVTLYGGLKPKERLAALDRLASTPVGGAPLLVVATDRYIGEGFDCPRLDTVFLTYPLSSESPIIQYVGRILREHPGKTDAVVHDYADTKVPMLARMHGKRLTAYRRLGFAAGPVQPPPAGPPTTTGRPPRMRTATLNRVRPNMSYRATLTIRTRLSPLARYGVGPEQSASTCLHEAESAATSWRRTALHIQPSRTVSR